MKRITCLVVILSITAITGAYAQESASASATATVVTPIAITKSTDMNFGNVTVKSDADGTVILAPAGTREATAGASLPTTAGNVGAASFTITGEANYTYSITLPESVQLSSDGNVMSITNFKSVPSGTGTLSAQGAETVSVGATLNLGVGQAAGEYTATEAVTVNYN